MSKKLKIFFMFLFVFTFLSLCNCAKANTINKISMDIFIDDNGDAQVTEIWNCKTNQGTEVYHPYHNIGNSKISNLSVSENGQSYTTLSYWNTSGTLDSKAYKCGINTISNGVELCWGISTYGSHTYTIKYSISNFVSDLTDSQMVYWTLIPYNFSNSIGNAYIKIHANNPIDNSVGVWGYGNYGGTAYVYDGYIEMQSDGSLTTDEYMTILVQFPSETFNCKNKINKNFDYYLDMANEGSTQYSASPTNYGSSTMSIVFGIGTTLFSLFFTLLPILIVIFAIAFSSISSNLAGAKLPKEIPYFRDIPCDNDLYKAYYIGYKYKIIKNQTDILGAIILKWLKECKIRIDTAQTGKIFKKEGTVIILNKVDLSSFEDSTEKKLFNMLLSASGDGILESREFEKWCSSNYTKILSWFDKLIDEEENKLIAEGLITVSEEKAFKFFKYKKHSVTEDLNQQALELAGLKKFLLDYTLIAERTAIEVNLFEDYLIYAQMMGIAKKVAKQFKDLYPDVVAQSAFYSYDNIIFINTCASHGITQANSAKSRAESYSSGGGGFSSGGGGGGSFGGGGGGGGGFR